MHSAASTRWRKAASLRSLARASRRRSAIRARLARRSVGVERLEDVVGRPLAQGGDRPLEVGVAGHDDHGGVGGRGLEPGQELLGGRVGEPAVEDDRREPRPVVAAERLGGACPPSRRGGRRARGCRAGWPACPRRPRSPGCPSAGGRPSRLTAGVVARPPPCAPRPGAPAPRAAAGRRTACSRPRRPPRRAPARSSWSISAR